MKRVLTVLALALTLISCKKRVKTERINDSQNNDPLETVVIGGTEWTKYNLSNPKQAPGGATFATKLPSQCSGVRAESHGKLYQWGRNVAWSTTGTPAATPSGEWQTSAAPSSWHEQPCPEGFRLPTGKELSALVVDCIVSRAGGWSSDDYGYVVLTTKEESPVTLEFPAVGLCDRSNGALTQPGANGGYWSSSTDTPDNAYRLFFGKNEQKTLSDTKGYAMNIRCVKGDPETEEPENPDVLPLSI